MKKQCYVNLKQDTWSKEEYENLFDYKLMFHEIIAINGERKGKMGFVYYEYWTRDLETPEKRNWSFLIEPTKQKPYWKKHYGILEPWNDVNQCLRNLKQYLEMHHHYELINQNSLIPIYITTQQTIHGLFEVIVLDAEGAIRWTLRGGLSNEYEAKGIAHHCAALTGWKISKAMIDTSYSNDPKKWHRKETRENLIQEANAFVQEHSALYIPDPWDDKIPPKPKTSEIFNIR